MVDNPRPNPIEANYSVWTADSTITLCNVPWSGDYRDIVDFADETAKKSWFDNNANYGTRITNASYARLDQPVSLQVDFNIALNYNYVRVENPALPSAFSKVISTYYYFVTGVEFVNPGVTRIGVQLDVWMTFGSRVKFGTCYIERGHLGIANQNAFNNFGRDFLTIPEGMDVGNEYQTVHHVTKDVMYTQGINHPIDTSMDIMVASTVDLEKDPGDGKDPELYSAPGDNIQGMPSGASYYFFNNVDDFRNFMFAYAKFPWMTQGIISITAVPEVSRYGQSKVPITAKVNHPITGAPIIFFKGNMGGGQGTQHYFMTDWRNSDRILNNIPERYRSLKKFLTYPYMALELTAFSGSPIVMKPEAWNDPDAWVAEKAVYAAPNQRITWWPVKYNAGRGSTIVDRSGGTIFDDNGEYMDLHTQVSNLPTFALVNNGYLAFMASNAHGIAQQYAGTGWSQTRALASNQVSYDQANNAIQTGASNALIGRNTAIYQNSQANEFAAASAVVDGMASVGQGIMGANPVSVAGGVVSGGMGAARTIMGNANRSAVTGINNQAAAATQQNTQNSQSFMANTNKGLADWAANGDYQNAINSINAKVQDAQLIQPSVSGQQGGEAFNLIHGGIQISLRFKMLSYNAMQTIGDFWLRYGYAVHRFIEVPKIRVMTKFTYWKMSETYLTGTGLPELYKNTIRGIFEKGVTVWSNPADIGATDIADNDPLPGIVIPVAPDPEAIPEPPVIPNLDEEDAMYLVSNNGNFWTIGKQYLALQNVLNTGTGVPQQLVGVTNPIGLSNDDLPRAFRWAGIPERYVNRDTFSTENPSGIWSQESDNAAAIAAARAAEQGNADAINTRLDALAQLVANLDAPTTTDPS
jgi:hypothetical protein